MANKIQIHRTSTYNATSAPSSLSYGELAWVNGSNKLYIGVLQSNNSTVNVTEFNSIVTGQIPDSAAGTKGLVIVGAGEGIDFDVLVLVGGALFFIKLFKLETNAVLSTLCFNLTTAILSSRFLELSI